MDAISLAIITVAIILFCNLIGILISFAPFYIKSLYKKRIQSREIKIEQFKGRLPLILMNISLLTIISGVGIYFLYPIFDPSLEIKPFTILWQLAVVLIVDDFFFYLFHKWMHDNKYILHKIHGIHHRSAAPFALDYLYVHPLEWMIGYIGPFIGIIAVGLSCSFSIWAFWLYQFLRNLHELDIHSGFKSSLSKYIPLWGESEHHDKHHEKLDGNYASTFTIWDHIFGTKI